MIKPLHDRVLIKPETPEQKTKSGLYIPDTASEKPQRGEVIAVGNGKKDEPMTVSQGDRVLYSKYGGQEVKIEGEDYIILKENEILAVI